MKLDDLQDSQATQSGWHDNRGAPYRVLDVLRYVPVAGYSVNTVYTKRCSFWAVEGSTGAPNEPLQMPCKCEAVALYHCGAYGHKGTRYACAEHRGRLRRNVHPITDATLRRTHGERP